MGPRASSIERWGNQKKAPHASHALTRRRRSLNKDIPK
jgi:hypothetical protein